MSRREGIPGVILAGGLGTRMGGDGRAPLHKGLLALGDTTLIGAVIARLAPQCAGLAINANGDSGGFVGFGLPVLPDTVPGFAGPLAGVLVAMDHAAALGFSQVLTAAADTPFPPGDLLERLRAATGSPIALAATACDGRLIPQPVFGLWPVGLRADLRHALSGGTTKVTDWAGRHGFTLTGFAPVTTPVGRFDPFFNVNAPEDLARAQQIEAHFALPRPR